MMIDTRDRSNEPSLDSSPLELHRLSDNELMVIFEIERRLSEVSGLKDASVGNLRSRRAWDLTSPERYLATAEKRYPRVLLLDGGRGTGKTSVLLTLVKRWHTGAGLHKNDGTFPTDLKERIDGLRNSHRWIPEDGRAPSNVRVVPILDFDPLPPEVPLVAGIIQAWRPLAEAYSPSTVRDELCEDEGETLLDHWHKLFRVAAVGWATIPKQSGLIEQVLDQEEQVRDWQRLDKKWRDFVDDVIRQGKCLQDSDKLADDPVFVIMIDDVDLQVERIRELLPALRMLYHPRVFYLVAADKHHMIDMLKLDFLGKQNKLARYTNGTGLAIKSADEDRWAGSLAESAFEKVFPKRSRWTLERLNLLGFLAFPHQHGTTESLHNSDVVLTGDAAQEDGDPQFLAILNQIRRRPQKTDNENPTIIPQAGEFIRSFGELAGSRLPGVITYRAVHQLYEYIRSITKSRPAAVLAGLLSGNDDATAASVEGDIDNNGPMATSDIESPIIIEAEPLAVHNEVDVRITGELAALYRAGPTELAGDYNIVLSARPDFVFIRPVDAVPIRMSTMPDRFNFTAALAAKALQIANFPVDAAGLQWNTYLSLAWTEWPILGLSFAWTRHVHPRPDQLFEQTGIWSDFLRLELEPDDKLELYAYSWVYYQRLWSNRKAKALEPNKRRSDGTLDWPRLLRFNVAKNNKLSRDNKEWLQRTLPLLARPEVGLPPRVQWVLLKYALKADVTVKLELKRQRRRLVTDAFVAAEAQRGRVVRALPEGSVVEGWITTIDKLYTEAHSEPSPWNEIEEVEDPLNSNNPTGKRG